MTDDFTRQVQAAYKAIVRTRAQGSFDNTLVYDAALKASSSLDSANATAAEAVRMAHEVYAENRAANQGITL